MEDTLEPDFSYIAQACQEASAEWFRIKVAAHDDWVRALEEAARAVFEGRLHAEVPVHLMDRLGEVLEAKR